MNASIPSSTKAQILRSLLMVQKSGDHRLRLLYSLSHYLHIPGGAGLLPSTVFPKSTIVLVKVCNQQFRGDDVFLIFDFQGNHFTTIIYSSSMFFLLMNKINFENLLGIDETLQI